MTELSALVQEYKEMLKNGEDIPIKLSRRIQLAISIDTHDEVKKINGRLKKVEKVAEEWSRFPSLTWLLYHKTKKTVTFIVVVFIILTVFYVSGLRAPIMEFLGLPPLLP
jgi:hypothetical protein